MSLRGQREAHALTAASCPLRCDAQVLQMLNQECTEEDAERLMTQVRGRRAAPHCARHTALRCRALGARCTEGTAHFNMLSTPLTLCNVLLLARPLATQYGGQDRLIDFDEFSLLVSACSALHLHRVAHCTGTACGALRAQHQLGTHPSARSPDSTRTRLPVCLCGVQWQVSLQDGMSDSIRVSAKMVSEAATPHTPTRPLPSACI